MKISVTNIEEIRTNTYQVWFSNGKIVVVHAPNVNTAIERAYKRI